MAVLGDTKAVSLTLLDGVIGNLNPTTNNTYTLGTSSLKWNNIYATTLSGSLATSNLSGQVSVSNGGTGTASFTANSVIISGSTTTAALTTRGILNLTSKSALGWNSAGNTHADNLRFPTVNTLTYWNGAYSGTSSNLLVLGTITTGVWNGTPIAASYIGDHSTDKLTSGTLANARLPARLLEYHTTATNDTAESGWYYGNSGSPFTKYHTGNADFMVWTHGYSSVWASELATDFKTNRFAVRNLNNGTWNSWRELAGNNDIVNEFVWSSDIDYDSINNRFTNTRGTNAWESQIYSKHGFADGCYVSFRVEDTTHYRMVGLNSDPTNNANYNTIDYAWYPLNGGNLSIYENGTSISSISGHTTYAAGDDFRIEYNNGQIRYYHNGVCCRTVERAISGLLYLDSSFHNAGTIVDLRFGPLSNIGIINIAHGGTGATTAADARTNLGITAANVVGTGTKALFYRGDNSWSNTLEGNLSINHLYTRTDNTYDIGQTGVRWRTAYLTTSLLVGAKNSITAYNSNKLGSFVGPGQFSACFEDAITNNGYYIFRNQVLYARLFINAAGKAGSATTFTNPSNSSQTITGYTGAVPGVTILALGNDKAAGVNGTSYSNPGSAGMANNSRGILRLYGEKVGFTELSTYYNVIGSDTGTTRFYSTNGFVMPENKIGILFRPSDNSYYTSISYLTGGDQALVFGTKNSLTSFIFINGEDPGSISSSRWQSLTPALQIKDNSVYIGELIANSSTPNYKFKVTGASYFNGATTMNGHLAFTHTSDTAPGYITWRSDPVRQRIQVDDNTTNNDAVFTFKLSEDSGTTYKDLFIIKDNGNITLGTKMTATLPTGTETSSAYRITITPSYYAGPWYVVTRDDATYANLLLKFGNDDLINVRHDGAVYPKTDSATLGTATYEWKDTYSKKFIVEQHVTMQWNSTDQSLDFIFA